MTVLVSRDAQSSGQDLSDQTFDALRQKIIDLQAVEVHAWTHCTAAAAL